MDEDAAFDAVGLSALIGLIYDTAGDQTLWPQLLEAMARYLASDGAALVPRYNPDDGERMVTSWFDGSGAPLPMNLSNHERLAFAQLAPHFVRAQELQRQALEVEEHKRLLERSLDQLPLGIAVTDGDGAILSINRALISMLHDHACLSMSVGRLESRPRKALADALRAVAFDDRPDVPLRLEDGGGGLSVWVSRLSGVAGAGADARVAIWVASRDVAPISEAGLCVLFGTTSAEARLVQRLMTGRSLDDVAVDLGTSINTVKTQLKAVFAKVGVHRQSELMHALYSTPLWLDVGRDPSRAGQGAGIAESPRALARDEHVVLPDGRRLFWSDTGDPAGLPVIQMHGLLCSRHMRHPDDAILYDEGIRLLIPERPGNGDSDPQPSRRVVDWASDVEAMANHLRIQRFVVLGYSAGTPYAFATAQRLAQRVLSLFVVCGVPPVERLEDLQFFSPLYRMVLSVARFAPNLLPALLRFANRGIRKNVYTFIESEVRQMPAPDRRVFDNPVFRENYARSLLVGIRDEQYMATELLLSAHASGVTSAPLQMPVHFYHGEADNIVAVEGARRLVDRIPGATLHLIPGGGHFLLYSHWREILRGVRASADCGAPVPSAASTSG